LRPLGVSQNESVHPKLESQPSPDENPESQQTLGSFGDYVDPSDLQFFHGRRAERLKAAAEVAGFAPQITMLSRSEMGGLAGFTKRQYELAEFRRMHGDI
ncbi:hypothetical protein IVB27_24275, partial [Bradyrhizobium sp. 197]|uniref:hypothetical protein n=1 Tax=Bradyrhizobium sp. 197 TaxID=2782663 RepID=UPI001FFB11C3